ncbi:Threonine dehydrogenase [Natronincola peptidivorans]|uniref:Threonine dehydrogenase n=1 Tax=Natronincola peptidivorans TaxID=426128 RepID=A0A1I0E5Y9_9FIRM|nr:hypothetical protein [Natronincola peptidivorans]SET40563.1 Threonine dehydrogenase [Natronincola peptidivorans]
MKTTATYFMNNKNKPLQFGEIDIENSLRKRLRGENIKQGILCEPVCVGFCGTDYELFKMSEEEELQGKLPDGKNRLINGHEGVVYIPSQKKFAVVLIRGGDSWDPTRYSEDEEYFEYGCDKADGMMAKQNFFHPDMLLPIPEKYIKENKIPLSLAKKLTFADPYACGIFQLERMEDLGSAHNFRIELARHKCTEEEARKIAQQKIFERVVIFGFGTTGMFIADNIIRRYPKSKIVFIGREENISKVKQETLKKLNANYISNIYENEKKLADKIVEVLDGKATAFVGSAGTSIEHRIAFDYEVLGTNGIFNSFSLGPKIQLDTMPFGFKNHLIYGSINFRQQHMEEAIEYLCQSDFDKYVELVDLKELEKDIVGLFKNKIFAKGSPIKTATLWNPQYIDHTK